MIRLFAFLSLFSGSCYAVHAQSAAAADSSQVTNKPYMSERYVEGLLAVDQQRFNLAPDQAAKAKVAWTDYAAKFNELSKNITSAADYKAGIRTLDQERIKQFKTFLTADQYAKLVTTYNKFHPKTPIEP